jgi:hypothetical protein
MTMSVDMNESTGKQAHARGGLDRYEVNDWGVSG